MRLAVELLRVVSSLPVICVCIMTMVKTITDLSEIRYISQKDHTYGEDVVAKECVVELTLSR